MPEAVGFSPTLRPVSQGDNLFKSTILPAVVILLIILSGVATGWFLSKEGAGKVSLGSGDKLGVAPGVDITSGGKEVGLDDAKTFRDKAEGMLEEGGIDSEGTHHLVRPGGDSQSVYLTSSVVDLNQFVGKKVEVWGETIGAKKAGWLMDVGKIKILE